MPPFTSRRHPLLLITAVTFGCVAIGITGSFAKDPTPRPSIGERLEQLENKIEKVESDISTEVQKRLYLIEQRVEKTPELQ